MTRNEAIARSIRTIGTGATTRVLQVTGPMYGHNGYATKTYHHMPNQRVVIKGKTRAVCGAPVRSVSRDAHHGRTECQRCRKARGF